jgi:phage/conjugal plasmid C-4 type zinc finger TraR family protein
VDAADRAQQEVDADLAEQLERQARAAALDARGSDICADCQDPIPLARRRALPSAIRCINCQAFAERVARVPNHA